MRTVVALYDMLLSILPVYNMFISYISIHHPLMCTCKDLP